MKIEAVIQQAEQRIGQVVELEGYLLVVREGDHHIPYLSAQETLEEDLYLPISHRVAELKRMIQPMHTMILIAGGTWHEAPYVYRFPVRISAEIGKSSMEIPTVHQIHAIEMRVPYPSHVAHNIESPDYTYHAWVTYQERSTNDGPQTKAQIMSRKILSLAESEETPRILRDDENCYARRVIKKLITIPGWLQYAPISETLPPQFVLTTGALRSAITRIGPMRQDTRIWWRQNPGYALLRSQLGPARDISQDRYRVEVTGYLDYLEADKQLAIPPNTLNLVFTNISQITLFQDWSLLA